VARRVAVRCGEERPVERDVLGTRIDPASEPFRRNRERNLELLAQVDEQLALARAGGGPAKLARHRSRDKLTLRERIALLVDRDSPLLELQPLIGWGSDFHVGGSSVSGIGVVAGVECLIGGADPTVKGGASNPYSVTKALRNLQIARENRLPVINLTESAGADLTTQKDIFVRGRQAPSASSRRCRRPGSRRCQLVFGNATAGGAYVPGMSDYTVMIERALEGVSRWPPAGEDGDRGGVHRGGARRCRRCTPRVSGLATTSPSTSTTGSGSPASSSAGSAGPSRAPVRRCRPRCRLHDPDELLGIASVDLREPFDAHEVLARVLDGSSVRTLQGRPTARTSSPVGGRSTATRSGSWPTTGCSSRPRRRKAHSSSSSPTAGAIPLVFLQNITGFMVGTQYEQGGIIKDGAKLINAVTNSEVPHVTLMMGASYGAGNYGMCGRAYDPRVRVQLAQPPHRRDGAPAARRGLVDRRTRRRREPRRGVRRRQGRRRPRRWSSRRSRQSPARSSPPGRGGTTGSSTRATRAMCSAWRCPPPTRRGPWRHGLRGVPDVMGPVMGVLVVPVPMTTMRLPRGADRQPRGDRGPHRPHLPGDGHRHRRGPLRCRRRQPARSRCATRPSGWVAPARPTATCAPTCSSPPPTHACRRGPSRVRVPVRGCRVRPARRRRRADLGRATARRDRGDG
jgi:acyl-CoA carboxylase subunit beta